MYLENKIVVKALGYEKGSKLPSPVDTFFLQVQKMQGYDSDLFDSYIYYDTVYSDELIITSTLYPNFGPGRYVFYVEKNGLSDVLDMYYRGGDFELRMVLK